MGIDTFGGAHCFGNKELLTDLHPVEPIELTGVGGRIEVNQAGYFARGGVEVYYSPSMPVNMLSWGVLSDDYSIEWDQPNQEVNLLCLEHTLTFRRNADNVYVHDAHDSAMVRPAFPTTVEHNQQVFTRGEVASADRARELTERLGGPSDRDLAKMCKMGVILNNPVSPTDVWRASKIYGRDLASIRGKTKRHKPIRVVMDHIPRLTVSSELVGHIDLMFVEGIPMLICVTTPLYHLYIRHVKGRSYAVLSSTINQMLTYYKGYGFGFRGFHVDGEGAIVKMESDLNSMGIKLNVTAKQPVPLVEAKVRQVKERVRGILSVNPFTLSIAFLVYLVYFVCFGINCVPSAGMSEFISPWECLTGRKPNYKTDLALSFCDYVEVHENNDIINSVSVPRTRPALALYPRGNKQGSWVFYALDSERLLVRDFYTKLPMPQQLIDHLNAKARQERAVPADPKFRLTRATNTAILPEDADESSADDPSLSDEPTTMVKERENADTVETALPLDDSIDDTDDQPSQSLDSIVHRGIDPSPDESVATADSVHAESSDREIAPPTVTIDHDATDAGQSEPANQGHDLDVTDVQSVPEIPEEQTQPMMPDPPTRHGLRPRPSIRDSARRWQEDGRWDLSMEQRERIKAAKKKSYGLHVSLKKARKIYNRRADEAAIKELSQLHRKKVWEIITSLPLSRSARRKIIRSSIFLKEKFTASGAFDKLKARLVAGGHQQDRSVYTAEETTSPTATLQSVYMIAGIAAAEGRSVASMDIGGAYLNAELEKEVIMRIDKELADLLETVDSGYKDAPREPDGSILVRLKKALYGLAESSNLWYKLLSKYFTSLGFKPNNKDKCVLNIDMKGTQCTVCIYVDDILCTSRDRNAIEWVRSRLEEKFHEVSINWGPKISYLGQSFDFSAAPRVKVRMEGYVADLLHISGVKGLAVTPALDDLFDVKVKDTPLDVEQKEEFHSLVAKVLYLAKRTRPDLLLVANFLSTRVSSPTEGDRDKLDRALRYLNSTQELGINIDVHKNIHVVAYIDASFAVHKDFKSHTGAIISLGSGPVWTKSTKQRLVSKSSTEAEIIGVSDALSQVIWTRDFLIDQGYNVGPSTLLQDNKSAIQMLEKGEATAERSRHIGIRFFFAKDKIDSGEIALDWLGTDDMLADLLTKPLQGSTFRALRDRLLNW